MTILLSSFGGGGLPRLAPDLNFPLERASGASTLKSVNLTPTPGTPEAALSLSGKWAVNFLEFLGLTSEALTIKLTVDGVIIWNSTVPPATTQHLLGEQNTNEAYQCESSFLLEITTISTTSCRLDYLARPIL